jgi:hypothetical protein
MCHITLVGAVAGVLGQPGQEGDLLAGLTFPAVGHAAKLLDALRLSK